MLVAAVVALTFLPALLLQAEQVALVTVVCVLALRRLLPLQTLAAAVVAAPMDRAAQAATVVRVS
jgi:hypothetical protein